MDFYSGSVPRRVILFRLDMEKTKDPKTTSDKPLEESGSTTGICLNQPPPKEASSAAGLFASSGSSQEDVNQYAQSYISQIESGQELISPEQVTSVTIGDPPSSPGMDPDYLPPSSTPRIASSGLEEHVDKTAPKPVQSCAKTPSKHPFSLLHIPPRVGESQSDNDSDVLSLGDNAVALNPNTLFPDSDTGTVVAEGEPCFNVLHCSHQLGGSLDPQDTDDSGAAPSSSRGNQGGTVLNTLDPFPHLRRLSGPSRSLLKKYFETNAPVELSKDHTTVAFSEDQVYNLIRVACDETAHASFEMMGGLLHQAAQLPSSSFPPPQQSKSQSTRRFRAATPLPSFAGSTSGSDVCPVSSDSESVTSGAIRTGDSDVSDCGQTDIGETTRDTPLASPMMGTGESPEPSGSSQEKMTLAILQKEAVKEFSRHRGDAKITRSVGVGEPPPTKPRMSRPDKVFKESYFRKIEWARVFVSGPMNPLENPNCFYCQICCRNVSIYGKGAAEVKRHYASREHFRKDQKWRYTHRSQTDLISGTVTHFVRNKKGGLLGKLELEMELPKFVKENLVEIGEKLPFYEDFKASRESVTPGTSRPYTQLCLVGDFLKSSGDFSLLRGMWNNVGTFTNHQSLFADFDWSDEKLTVSAFCLSCFEVSHCPYCH